MSGAQKSEIESGELVAPTVRTTQSFKDSTTLQLYCRRLQRSGRLETHQRDRSVPRHMEATAGQVLLLRQAHPTRTASGRAENRPQRPSIALKLRLCARGL